MNNSPSEQETFTSQPALSVIIPTFDRADLLPEAIDSVLSQDCPDVELVIVDDGSTDTTAEIVAGYAESVRYCWQENQGVSQARNTGVAMSASPFIAFLDSDDLMTPHRLRLQLRVLQHQPLVEAVFGQIEQFYDPSLSTEFCRNHPIKVDLSSAQMASSMLIRRTAFERVGNFNTSREIAPDLDWHLRAVDAGLQTFMLDDVVLHRRIHYNNFGVIDAANANRRRVLALKEAIDRRRVAAGSPAQSAHEKSV